jgi:hypothetical protein
MITRARLKKKKIKKEQKKKKKREKNPEVYVISVKVISFRI